MKALKQLMFALNQPMPGLGDQSTLGTGDPPVGQSGNAVSLPMELRKYHFWRNYTPTIQV